MESFFNTSFADVRVHVGHEAPSIGALAFTHGTDLYFAPGQYNPQSTQGQQLLGHELTHVVQQRAGRVRNPLGAGVAVVQDPALEAEAERMGLRAATLSQPLRKTKAPHPKRTAWGSTRLPRKCARAWTNTKASRLIRSSNRLPKVTAAGKSRLSRVGKRSAPWRSIPWRREVWRSPT